MMRRSATQQSVSALRPLWKEARTLAGFVAAVGLFLAAPAFAHHSDTIYDKENLVTVTGTVAQFEFTNPHVVIFLDVKGDDGRVNQWIAFGGAPGALARVGWNKNLIKTGEPISILGFQFEDGRKGLLLLKVVRADGKLLPIGEAERNYLRKFEARQSSARAESASKN
jgi:uncharacterized protein DUF6152